jgi:iron-sulfur cluster repair protein YtfE (RIC family)
MPFTQEIRQEHRQLMGRIERIREAGDRVGEVRASASREEVDRVLDFIRDELVPHAAEEERVLYPEVARIFGSPDSIRTMIRDHQEIRSLSQGLARATEEDDIHLMRRLLYGLYHVVRLHFAKEEEIYLPALEGSLTPEESEALSRHLHVV